MRFLLFLLFLSSLSLCARRKMVAPTEPPDILLEKGIREMNQGRYKEAERIFTEIIYHHASSAYWEDAQFFLAETYFKKKDYYQAKNEFRFFIRSFPGSRYYEEASYKYALSFLLSLPKISRDVEDIRELEEFILNFKDKQPNSLYRPQMDSILFAIAEREAKKEFSNGFLYYKAGEWQSAAIYFEYITKEFPDTETALEAKFLLGEICWRNGEKEKAKEMFEELLAKPIREGVRKKIGRYLSER